MSPGASRVFVAGHRGLAGSAIVRRLAREPNVEIQTATREQLDLRDQAAVTYWFKANRPEYVYLAAGTVGGIFANSTRPAEFIYDNMMIHATVVHAAHQYGAKKLLYLGSSCIYPRDSAQPMTEAALLTGALEPTNEAVRHRQDRRDQAVPGLPARSTAIEFHLGDADQPLRPERQLRPEELARAAGDDAQVPRREGVGHARGRDLGHRVAAPRVPARRRPGRRLRVPDGRITRRQGTSTSAPARI